MSANKWRLSTILFYLNIAANETKKKKRNIQECKKEKYVVRF